MIWLAWRQFRTPAVAVAAILVAVAVVYGVTGPGLAHMYDTVIKPCTTNHDCHSVTSIFLAKDRLLQEISKLLLYFPVLLGMFWGAPLVAREMETGTFRLSWTQSVTRRRWFANRAGMVVLASLVATGLLSLMITWWSSPFDTFDHFAFGTFDQRDIVSIGYAAFAVTLGVAAGALLRRTIPAMGATLVGFVAVRYFVTDWIRKRLESPVRITTKFLATVTNGGRSITRQIGHGLKPGDWVVSNTVVNAGGHAVPQIGLISIQHCDRLAVNEAFQKCVDSYHLRSVLAYQPAGRYWLFQWEEMSIFLALAVILSAFSYWWIRRRVT